MSSPGVLKCALRLPHWPLRIARRRLICKQLQRKVDEKLRKLQDSFTSGIQSISGHLSTTEEAANATGLEVGLLRDELRTHGQIVLTGLTMIENLIIERQTMEQNVNNFSGRETLRIVNQVVQYLPPTSLTQAVDTFTACRCNNANTITPTSSSYSLYRIKFFARGQILARHERTCPLYAVSQKRVRELGTRTRIRLARFLDCLVEIILSCCSGAGGFSFGPSVRWKNVVPRHMSTVLRLFETFEEWLRSGTRKLLEGISYA